MTKTLSCSQQRTAGKATVFERTAPVGVEGALVGLEGETLAVLVQRPLKVALLHQVIALPLQQGEAGFLLPGCGTDERQEAVSGGGNADDSATVLRLFIIVVGSIDPLVGFRAERCSRWLIKDMCNGRRRWEGWCVHRNTSKIGADQQIFSYYCHILSKHPCWKLNGIVSFINFEGRQKKTQNHPLRLDDGKWKNTCYPVCAYNMLASSKYFCSKSCFIC